MSYALTPQFALPGPPSRDDFPPFIQSFIDHPGSHLGPWLIGSLADYLLAGVLLMQFWSYMRHHKCRDHFAIKFTVLTLFLLTVVKSAQTFAVVWRMLVIRFADWVAVTGTAWPQISTSLLTGFIGAVVQTFFAWRLHRLLGNKPWVWVLLILILLSMLVGLAGCIALTILITQRMTVDNIASFESSVIISILGAVVCDLLITGSTLWTLLKSRTGFCPTDRLIDRLVLMTWSTAAPPTICALFNLGFYLGQASNNTIFIAFNTCLSKFYTISVLYTLNNRKHVINKTGVTLAEYRSGSGTYRGAGSDGVSGKANGVLPPLAPLSSVRIMTHVETVTEGGGLSPVHGKYRRSIPDDVSSKHSSREKV